MQDVFPGAIEMANFFMDDTNAMLNVEI